MPGHLLDSFYNIALCCHTNSQIIHLQNISARLSRESVDEAAGHRLTVRATSEARLWNEELKFDPSKGNVKSPKHNTAEITSSV